MEDQPWKLWPPLTQEEIDDALDPGYLSCYHQLTQDAGVIAPEMPDEWAAFGAATRALGEALKRMSSDDRSALWPLFLAYEDAGLGLANATFDEGFLRGYAFPAWLIRNVLPDRHNPPRLTPSEWLTSGELLRSALADLPESTEDGESDEPSDR